MSEKFLYRVEIVYKNIMFHNTKTGIVKKSYIYSSPEHAHKYLKYHIDKFCSLYKSDFKIEEYNHNHSEICEYFISYSSRNLNIDRIGYSFFYEGSCTKEDTYEKIDTEELDKYI